MSDKQHQFVLIPGMSAEYPVFARLQPLLAHSRILAYPAPEPNDTLESYSIRLAKEIDNQTILVGVSFGGMIAAELTRQCRTAGCVVISSILNPYEFPKPVRMLRAIGGKNACRLMRLASLFADQIPRRWQSGWAARMARLRGAQGHWHWWATGAMLNWNPKSIDSPLLRIHGDADTTFPLDNLSPDLVISGGKHALPVSHPAEVANAITQFASKL